jgi:hypothetical protein
MVDSGSRDEPANRHFGSRAAALAAFDELDARYQPFAWILYRENNRIVALIMRDGEICDGR